MEILYVIESGVRRKAEKHNCEYCNKEFLRKKKKKKSQKYCCIKCSRKGSRNRVIVRCTNCNKEIERKVSQLKLAKHGFYFCNRECKEEAQKLGGKCPEIRPDHFGTGTGEHSYRDHMREEIKLGCVDCFNKIEYLLNIHHIDGNRKNNKKENLEVTCSNCHKKRHLHLKDGNWSYWTRVLTPREILKDL